MKEARPTRHTCAAVTKEKGFCTTKNVRVDVSVNGEVVMCYVNTPPWTVPFGPCPVDTNTFEISLLCGNATPNALLGFASSGSRLFVLPVSACRPDRAFLRPHVPVQQLVLLLASRALLTCFFLRLLALRVQHAPWSPRHSILHANEISIVSWHCSGWRPTSYLTLPLVFLWRPGFPALVGRPDPSRSTQYALGMFHPSAPSSPCGLFSSFTVLRRSASCKVGAVRMHHPACHLFHPCSFSWLP